MVIKMSKTPCLLTIQYLLKKNKYKVISSHQNYEINTQHSNTRYTYLS